MEKKKEMDFDREQKLRNAVIESRIITTKITISIIMFGALFFMSFINSNVYYLLALIALLFVCLLGLRGAYRADPKFLSLFYYCLVGWTLLLVGGVGVYIGVGTGPRAAVRGQCNAVQQQSGMYSAFVSFNCQQSFVPPCPDCDLQPLQPDGCCDCLVECVANATPQYNMESVVLTMLTASPLLLFAFKVKQLMDVLLLYPFSSGECT